jgi:ribose transport system ATP-binding protein
MNQVASEALPLLRVIGLTKRYPGVTALEKVDFEVRPGEVHALLGQNGAGKSTLIKCISGFITPNEGEILFDDDPVPPGDTMASLSQGIATIYQELDLVDDLTVEANVWLGHESRNGPMLDRSKMRTRTIELLERLDHPRIDPAARVETLAPAAQQIVSIARALSRNVRLLIMDEPSAVLDDKEIEVLFGVVRRLTEAGVGVIYISHRLEEVARIADRVTVFKDGKTVLKSAPANTDPDELVRAMVGRRLDHMFPERAEATDRVVLEVKDLTRRGAIRNVSFELCAGEILGLAGLVGSGRTELIRAIYGLDPVDSGEVIVAGRTVDPGRPDIAMANGMGFAPEDRKSQGLLMHWTSARNVTIADLRSFVSHLLLNLRMERNKAKVHLESIGAQKGAVDKQVRLLSGGNQQKVVLARWLLRSCKILLLDEPTRGVDIGARAEIYKVIGDLAARGLGIIMVSSELPELLSFCDRILVLRDGRLVRESRADEITEEEILNLSIRTHATAPEDS